jgi:nicotinate-nucleotide--dimethylbenzimidazole phosphoribosyltransferase
MVAAALLELFASSARFKRVAIRKEADLRGKNKNTRIHRKTAQMSVSGLPFDDFRTLLRDLPGPDARALVAARERDAQLTKPPGALGRLEEIAFWLAAWTGRTPAVNRPLVAIFAGNHGVTKQGITPFSAHGDATDGR